MPGRTNPKTYGGVAKAARGRGGRGGRSGGRGGGRGGGRAFTSQRKESGNQGQLADAPSGEKPENQPPPEGTVEWYAWKQARVRVEAQHAKEQLERHQAIYNGHIENLANLEMKKRAAEAAGQTVSGLKKEKEKSIDEDIMAAIGRKEAEAERSMTD